MDNMTAKVSCFARAYHFENNKTLIFTKMKQGEIWLRNF